jgi:IPT/TIG domain/Concanavalin A-like lectin/glucanases superfamily
MVEQLMATVANMIIIRPDTSLLSFTLDSSELLDQGYWRGPIPSTQGQIAYSKDRGFVIEKGGHLPPRLQGEYNLILSEPRFIELTNFIDYHWQQIQTNQGDGAFITLYDLYEPIREFTRTRTGLANFSGTPGNVNKFYPRFKVLLARDSLWFNEIGGNSCSTSKLTYVVKLNWIESRGLREGADPVITPVISSGPVTLTNGATYSFLGSNLLFVTSVLIRGVNTIFQIISNNEIRVFASGALGATTLTASTQSATSNAYAVTLVGSPAYTSLSSSSVGLGQQVTLNGAGFYPGLVPPVTGGTVGTITFVNSFTMLFTPMTAGSFTIGGLSLTVSAAATYTGVSPGSVNGGGTFTLTGTGFYQGLTPPFSGSSAPVFTFVSPTVMTFALSVSGSYTVAGFPVTVVSDLVSYSSVSPSTATPGTLVTLTGVNLSSTTPPIWTGGSQPTFNYVNSTTITFIAPSNGNYTVGGLALNVSAMPTYSSLTPATISPGTTVTLTGTNLSSATPPVWTGGNQPVFTYVNSTTITFIAPAVGSYTVGGLAVTVVVPSVIASNLIRNINFSGLGLANGVAISTAGVATGTGATRPVFNTSEAIPFARFDLSQGHYMTLADAVDIQFGTGDFEVQIAVRSSSYAVGPTNQVAFFSKDFTGLEAFAYQSALGGYAGGTANSINATAPVIATGVWHLISLSRSGNAFSLYQNTTLIGSSTLSGSANVSAPGVPLLIGQRPGSLALGTVAAVLDSRRFLVYNRALTPAERMNNVAALI